MLLFLVAGGLNTLSSLMVFQVATALSHRPAAALVVSYLVGAGFSYLTGARLVFADHHAPSLPRFAVGVLAVLVLNLLAQLGLRHAGVDPRWSQVGLAPVMAVISYVVNRRLLFPRPRAASSHGRPASERATPSPPSL